ncbi:DEAD/DEAH box helicase [Natronosporangium hydrolyticum]|uniref:DEAD/DEAH box helicase n=1 Tax=Natronosporangium hydrolyticum TaxID=2811111 RepID=A0A895Y8N9_9ACTN|nr:DEAD/DEAH box helicase [Natronosporangium hydrolyticum]QSB12675.1 DEAD/DEAH box helicase [Natronosporangium hydrolyticum]
MTSPAERYAAARRRAAYPEFTEFAAGLDFAVDDFQRDACEAVERGNGVLVCAPTGAGKTVVGEFAVHSALRSGTGKCFYTTPIKALSNQKYHDLVRRHGADKVGLLTGDNSINGDAPVVVMTTEVLRNMLYAGSSTLAGLAYVVMDEVHYLADRFRGAVWEEVIIHLPPSVALISLSATVSNAEEFADWLVTVRGETEVVVSEVRPVPLWQHMMVGKRMFDLFHDRDAARTQEVNPELLRHTRELVRRIGIDGGDRGGPRGRDGARGRGRGSGRRGLRGGTRLAPYRFDVLERLDREGLLPAIVFIFSRAGCDAAVQQCLHAGLRLTTPEEQATIRQIAEDRMAEIPAEDLNVLGYWEWLDGLERGLAAHHAGALPAFKEVVEELFVRGLVKAVFATETLALGINMPARCVVLERLVKFDGEAHVDLTPGEYTQLTGRAGRRGIDVEGHAVVIWSPEVDPRQVAGLASTRTYPLRSSFRPSYNMAVNLVGTLGSERARGLLESSFAQFQADRAVVGIARQVQRNTDAIAAIGPEIRCELGDFDEYFSIRQALTEQERALSRQRAADRRAQAVDSLARLRVGDVIRVPSGRRAGLAVVLDPDTGGFGEPKPLLLTEQRWAGRVPASDFVSPVQALAKVRVPRNFNHRSPQARRDLAASLRVVQAPSVERRRTRRRGGVDAEGDDAAALDRLEQLRVQLRQHPCHGCDDREEHARAAERRARLERDTEHLRTRASSRTGSLARTFDRVTTLLAGRGYLTDRGELTDPGRLLARIWTESDLLVAECLRRGVWDGLDPAQLAAAVSVVVYEARRETEDPAATPRGPVADAITETRKLWSELAADESDRGLSLTREPDAGFVWPIYRWTNGEPLERVLQSAGGPDGELPAGDFVRWARQVVDLLGQIIEADGVPAGVRRAGRRAMDQIHRGVLARNLVR